MNRRALVIEDDPVVRRLEESLLIGEGYEVESAVDGKTALERLATQKYDVIVLDVGLPDTDGYDIARRLPTLEPNRDTPLVVITGSTDPAARRKGFAAGAAVFMAKPFTAEQFRAVVATVVP
jgi:two-component system chemotaxis response regulator CheY